MYYKRRLKFIFCAAMFLSLILWIFASRQTAFSFCLGVLVVGVSELFFTLLLWRKIQQKRPKGFLSLYVVAECLKLTSYAVLFVGVVCYMHASVLPALLGFICAIGIAGCVSFRLLGNG